MQLTVKLCLAQEAHHRARADAAILENARVIANAAANAWAREGLAAQSREDRQMRAQARACNQA